MGINKGEEFSKRDIYINYAFEEVMFRWDHIESKIFVKFYKKNESIDPVPHDNRLFNDALLYGEEISKNEYETQHSSKITCNKNNDCPTCKGKGQSVCPVCKGKGRPCDCSYCGNLEKNEDCGFIICTLCNGTGRLE